MASHFSDQDRFSVDTLLGRALLDDYVRSNLLDQRTRATVLGIVPLTIAAYRSLVGLDTAPDLNTFADWVWNQFYRRSTDPSA